MTSTVEPPKSVFLRRYHSQLPETCVPTSIRVTGVNELPAFKQPTPKRSIPTLCLRVIPSSTSSSFTTTPRSPTTTSGSPCKYQRVDITQTQQQQQTSQQQQRNSQQQQQQQQTSQQQHRLPVGSSRRPSLSDSSKTGRSVVESRIMSDVNPTHDDDGFVAPMSIDSSSGFIRSTDSPACAYCQTVIRENRLQCPSCLLTYYCSEEHQQYDRKRHKIRCANLQTLAQRRRSSADRGPRNVSASLLSTGVPQSLASQLHAVFRQSSSDLSSGYASVMSDASLASLSSNSSQQREYAISSSIQIGDSTSLLTRVPESPNNVSVDEEGARSSYSSGIVLDLDQLSAPPSRKSSRNTPLIDTSLSMDQSSAASSRKSSRSHPYHTTGHTTGTSGSGSDAMLAGGGAAFNDDEQRQTTANLLETSVAHLLAAQQHLLQAQRSSQPSQLTSQGDSGISLYQLGSRAGMSSAALGVPWDASCSSSTATLQALSEWQRISMEQLTGSDATASHVGRLAAATASAHSAMSLPPSTSEFGTPSYHRSVQNLYSTTSTSESTSSLQGLPAVSIGPSASAGHLFAQRTPERLISGSLTFRDSLAQSHRSHVEEAEQMDVSSRSSDNIIRAQQRQQQQLQQQQQQQLQQQQQQQQQQQLLKQQQAALSSSPPKPARFDHTTNQPFSIPPETHLKQIATSCQASTQQAAVAMRIKEMSQHVTGSLATYGWSIVDNFLGDTHANAVQSDVESLYTMGLFKEGQLMQTGTTASTATESSAAGYSSPGVANRWIRSDEIFWFDNRDRSTESYVGIRLVISIMDSIAAHIADRIPPYCIGGRSKAMIACYPGSGTRYVKHVDNADMDGRCVTAIYYFNLDWRPEAGGSLRLYPNTAEQPVDVEPRFDRLLLFWSDNRNPHEVLPTYRHRFALTIWYFDRAEKSRVMARLSRNSAHAAPITPPAPSTTTQSK